MAGNERKPFSKRRIECKHCHNPIRVSLTDSIHGRGWRHMDGTAFCYIGMNFVAEPEAERPASGSTPVESGCICSGNWRKIVRENEAKIDKWFDDHGQRWRLFGIVHGADDYYYGVVNDRGRMRLLSCVGSLENGWDLTPISEVGSTGSVTGSGKRLILSHDEAVAEDVAIHAAPEASPSPQVPAASEPRSEIATPAPLTERRQQSHDGQFESGPQDSVSRSPQPSSPQLNDAADVRQPRAGNRGGCSTVGDSPRRDDEQRESPTVSESSPSRLSARDSQATVTRSQIEDIEQGIIGAFCSCDLMAGHACTLHTRLRELRAHFEQHALAQSAELRKELRQAQDEAQENWQSVKRLKGELEAAELRLQQRWIPVSERLPEDKAPVLAWNGALPLYIAFTHDGQWFEQEAIYEDSWDRGNFVASHITHWMSLPDHPPSEAKSVSREEMSQRVLEHFNSCSACQKAAAEYDLPCPEMQEILARESAAEHWEER